MQERKPTFEYAIICDDIRHEIGDKFSLIGVYGSDICAVELPFFFPKLCAVVSYRNMRAGDTFVVELRSPSGKVLGNEIRGEVPAEVKGRTRFMIFGVMSPVHIEEAGLHNLVIVINQDEATRKEVPLKITTASARVVH
jgi:hypothetical protein